MKLDLNNLFSRMQFGPTPNDGVGGPRAVTLAAQGNLNPIFQMLKGAVQGATAAGLNVANQTQAGQQLQGFAIRAKLQQVTSSPITWGVVGALILFLILRKH